jgi:hypothetical protein
MEGLKRLVHNSKHRKEFVAGGLAEYLTAGMSNARRTGFRTELFSQSTILYLTG